MKQDNIGLIIIRNTPNRFNGISYYKHLLKNRYKINKIILVDLKVASNKLKKYLPIRLNEFITTSLLNLKFKKKCQRLKKIHDEYCSNIGIENLYDLDLMKLKKDIKDVVKISINNINDNKLIDVLNSSDQDFFIYSGGGILRQKILQATKFMHVHPGIVPDIRGAECLFWSILLKKKAGMSCFYMNEGIDTGEVLFKEEYELPDFKFLNKFLSSGYSKDELYESILYFYDVDKRAETVISALNNLGKMSYDQGTHSDDNQYYFMDKQIRNLIIDRLLGVSKDEKVNTK